jgi:MSHA pilin protein MshC
MRGATGFTLIELLLVMVIIGILSTIAVSRFSGREAFDELGYAQELATAARYAQKLAVATRCPVRFRMADAGQYRLQRPDGFAAGSCASNFAAEVVNPATGQAPYAGVSPNGVGVAGSESFPLVRVFDAEGGITPDADLSIRVGTRTVVVRRGGGQVVVQ